MIMKPMIFITLLAIVLVFPLVVIAVMQLVTVIVPVYYTCYVEGNNLIVETNASEVIRR